MSDPKAPPAFLGVIDKTYDLIAKLCMLLAGISLVVMTVIFAWLVFGRYILNDTPTWVEQVSLLLVMVIAFLGGAVGVHQNTHLSVVIFRSAVSPKVRNVFVFISDILMLVFGGLMFWHGIELAAFKWSADIPLLQWPEGLRSLPLTICGALLFLFSAGHLIRLFLGRDQRIDSIE